MVYLLLLMFSKPKVCLVTLVSLPCVIAYCPSAFAEMQNIAANSIAPVSSVTGAIKSNRVLEPTLVGVLVNGQEQGSIDALHESGSDFESDTQNSHYLLSIDDLIKLTNVSFVPIGRQNTDKIGRAHV